MATTYSSTSAEGARSAQRASRNRPRRTLISQGLIHLLLFVWCLIAVAPFIWSFFASFKSFRELVSSQDILPHVWTLNGYHEIFTRAHFLTAVRNSVVSAVSVTVMTCFTSAAVGY